MVLQVKHSDFLIALVTNDDEGMLNYLLKTSTGELEELAALLKSSGNVIDVLVETRKRLGL